MAPNSAGRPGATRVLLVVGDALYGRGLRALLAGQQDLEVVGEAHDCDTATECLRHLDADAVLLDPRGQGIGPLAAIRALSDRPLLMVMASAEGEPVEEAAALRTGARGLLLSTATPAELSAALRVVAAGSPRQHRGLRAPGRPRLSSRRSLSRPAPHGARGVRVRAGRPSAIASVFGDHGRPRAPGAGPPRRWTSCARSWSLVRLAGTAEVFAAGRVGLRHVEVIATVLATPAAGRLTPQVWAGAEAELADKATGYTPSKLAAYGRALVETLDQDGAEPEERRAGTGRMLRAGACGCIRQSAVRRRQAPP